MLSVDVLALALLHVSATVLLARGWYQEADAGQVSDQGDHYWGASRCHQTRQTDSYCRAQKPIQNGLVKNFQTAIFLLVECDKSPIKISMPHRRLTDIIIHWHSNQAPLDRINRCTYYIQAPTCERSPQIHLSAVVLYM